MSKPSNFVDRVVGRFAPGLPAMRAFDVERDGSAMTEDSMVDPALWDKMLQAEGSVSHELHPLKSAIDRRIEVIGISSTAFINEIDQAVAEYASQGIDQLEDLANSSFAQIGSQAAGIEVDYAANN